MKTTHTQFDDYIFQSVTPNYHRHALDITLHKGTHKKHYQMPFSVFKPLVISAKNRIKTLKILSELGHHAVEFELENGKGGDFPTDLVLYHCEPDYEWAPLNQIKMALQEKLKGSRISLRVMADALKTSPTQVMRLLQKDYLSKQWQQLSKLAQMVGYEIEIKLKKRARA